MIWSGDAVFNALLSQEESFLSVVTSGPRRELFFRAFMTAGFLLFGVAMALMLSKQTRAEKAVKRQSAAIEASLDGIAIYSRDGAYVYVNQAFASINGYENPAELLGKTFRNAYDAEELVRMEQVVAPALKNSGQWRGELIAKRKNGSTYFQEASISLLDDGGRVCIIRDITWRKRSEDRLRRSERFLNMIFNSIRDPFCIFDREFRVIRANEAYGALKGRSIDDLIGRKCYEALENGDTKCDDCVVDKSFRSADPCVKEKQAALPDGTPIWMEIYTYPILDEDGSVSHVIEYIRDTTVRKKAEEENRRLIERLEHLSNTDSLTGLMNRRALTRHLAYELERAKRYGAELSIILCDIDNFKEINDTWGHDMGDRALQAVSATLQTILRKADIVGRHGGDEFLLIAPETSDKGAEGLADKLLAAVRETGLSAPDGKPVKMTMSIGVACLDLGRDNIDSFVKRTDDAMYASKQAGRNRVTTAKN